MEKTQKTSVPGMVVAQDPWGILAKSTSRPMICTRHNHGRWDLLNVRSAPSAEV
jgi:hypothetical protein